jgi:hypothetical protein
MNDNAAERYLLGELTESEADAFEAHVFECHLCAADVRDGSMMMKAGRQFVREERDERDRREKEKENERRITVRRSLAAAAMLVIGIALYFMIPSPPDNLKHPPVSRDFQLYLGDARRGGVADEKVIPAGYDRALLNVDVASPIPYPRYVLTVHDARGQQIGKSETVTAAKTEEPVPLTLLLRDLPAGSYGVVIEGVREDGKRSKVTTLSFEIRNHGP